MDFEDVLQSWQNYQKSRLKMTNSYPCVLSFSFNPSLIHGNLSFVGTQEERRIEVLQDFGNIWRLSISEILGSNPEGSRIQFSLFQNRLMFVDFPNERIQKTVHDQWVIFEREEHGPTPPSSSDSD